MVMNVPGSLFSFRRLGGSSGIDVKAGLPELILHYFE